MTPTLVLVTRPEPDGSAFLTALRRAVPGTWQGVCAPLGRIAPLPLPAMPERAELVLTSRNAVAAAAVSGGRRAWCVGPATATAAESAGLAVAGVGTGGADALVALILRARPEAPLLHLRGEPSAGDVAGRLRAGGLEARDAVVYRQEAVPPGPAFREALEAVGTGRTVLAPVFSPRGARRLSAEAGWASLDAVALSPAVARALCLPGGRVAVCERPDAASMIAALAGRLGGGDPPGGHGA